MNLENFAPVTIVGECFYASHLLGKGTYGTVCCMRSRSGNAIAAKMILNTSDVQRTLNVRETSIMNKLQHPNITTYLGAWDINNGLQTVIYMNFAARGTLWSRCSDPAFMNKGRVRNFFRQMVDAVRYMHARGITHNDLKPDNVLLQDDNTIQIADFGMAQEIVYENGFEKPVIAIGTDCYNSPLKAANFPSRGRRMTCGHSV